MLACLRLRRRSILLLLRNRLAVWAFGLSLIGAVVSLIYGQVINPPPPLAPEMAMMSYMPWVITAIAAFTVSTSCFMVKGLGRKWRLSPSGRFFLKASSA